MCCSFRHGLRRDTFLKEEGFRAFISKIKAPAPEFSGAGA